MFGTKALNTLNSALLSLGEANGIRWYSIIVQIMC